MREVSGLAVDTGSGALMSGLVTVPPQPFFEPRPRRIAFAAAPTQLASASTGRLAARYGQVPSCDDAQAIVCLGGDGFLLEMLHRLLDTGRAHAGVRHELRLGRLPDERVRGGEPAHPPEPRPQAARPASACGCTR